MLLCYSHKVLRNLVVIEFRSWYISLYKLINTEAAKFKFIYYHGDERIQVINKPEFLEVSDCDFYSHLSFLNNIVDVDKLDILMDKNDVTHSEANTSDLERYINQKFDEIIIANTEKKVCKSHQLHKSDKYCQTSNEDSFKLKYLELENTRMATEIKFLRDQILEKDFIIRSLFMSKSVNRDNDDFSRNIKNRVDNVNKIVTPSSPHKNINTDKNVNNSNIQSNNNFATPADIFNRTYSKSRHLH